MDHGNDPPARRYGGGGGHRWEPSANTGPAAEDIPPRSYDDVEQTARQRFRYETGRIEVPVPPRGRDLPPIETTDPRQPIRPIEPGRANRYPNRRELLEAAVQGLTPAPEEDPLLDLKRFVLKLSAWALCLGIVFLLVSIFLMGSAIVGRLS
jgi:hypothetical protein